MNEAIIPIVIMLLTAKIPPNKATTANPKLFITFISGIKYPVQICALYPFILKSLFKPSKVDFIFSS